MRGETEIRLGVQGFQEGFVAAQVRVLDHFRKIADRLVGVDAKQEGDSVSHLGVFQLARRMVPPLSGVPPPWLIG